jgi:hypothetical protein
VDTVRPIATACAADGCRAVMRAVIQHVTGSVSMSAMAADPKHRQHLCCLVDWQQGSAKKKGLCMDCAGLVLLCYCLAQMLATDLPALRDVSMVVRSALGPCHAVGKRNGSCIQQAQ